MPKMLTLISSSSQGWPCRHHHPGQICGKEGKLLPPSIALQRFDTDAYIAGSWWNSYRGNEAD